MCSSVCCLAHIKKFSIKLCLPQTWGGRNLIFPPREWYAMHSTLTFFSMLFVKQFAANHWKIRSWIISSSCELGRWFCGCQVEVDGMSAVLGQVSMAKVTASMSTLISTFTHNTCCGKLSNELHGMLCYCCCSSCPMEINVHVDSVRG